MTSNTESLSEDQYKFLQLIEKEYIAAYKVLNFMPPLSLTVYGGAKLSEDDVTYKDTVKICHEMSVHGWSIVSGGGPGAMKAALIGGNLGKTPTTAFKIDLSRESTNKVADNEYLFSIFSPRKHALRQSDAYMFVPGGWGTFDELFELLTLQKVDKIPLKPVILYGKSFWMGLIDWLKDTALKKSLIKESELAAFLIFDTPDEVTDYLNGYSKLLK
jgi:uncharacterized protein (TIGR00730 family)